MRCRNDLQLRIVHAPPAGLGRLLGGPSGDDVLQAYRALRGTLKHAVRSLPRAKARLRAAKPTCDGLYIRLDTHLDQLSVHQLVSSYLMDTNEARHGLHLTATPLQQVN